MGTESEAAELNQSCGATSPEDVEALLDAARYGNLEDLMSLATAGVPLGSKDEQGCTALHMAAANGHLDIVNYLVGRGADVNAIIFLTCNRRFCCTFFYNSWPKLFQLVKKLILT